MRKIRVSCLGFVFRVEGLNRHKGIAVGKIGEFLGTRGIGLAGVSV